MDKRLIPGKFGISGTVQDVSLRELKAGHINSTYLADTPDGKYILQSLNMSVYSDHRAVERNLSGIVRCFEEYDGTPGVSIPHYLRTGDGSFFYHSGSEVWRMYRYSEACEPTEPPELCAGYACGAFMRVTGSKSPELTPAIDGFHDFRHHYEEYRAALRRRPWKMTSESTAIAEWLEPYYVHICDTFREVPKRPVHGDAKADNFIIGTDRTKCTVIDLDTVMYSYAAVDYGDLIRSSAGSGDMDAAAAITEGFSEGLAGVLTPIEISSLYHGVIYVTAELAFRYLTDFINGAAFFRSKTPEQCLERSRQLLVQLSGFTSKSREFDEIIRKYFSGGEK
ncbi:MAG: aminoglycoside phosphotransferase family protein [Ruminococcus sp.]|nr:aminoglycoside phosphotransferase family protein [Ruminococcus sp.]